MSNQGVQAIILAESPQQYRKWLAAHPAASQRTHIYVYRTEHIVGLHNVPVVILSDRNPLRYSPRVLETADGYRLV